jgi:carbonic anhydrase
VQAKPLGLHFHTPSEHLIGGRQFPLEMHIVHTVDNATLPGCGNATCLAVVGVLFEYGEEANPFIETIFSNMPINEMVSHCRAW